MSAADKLKLNEKDTGSSPIQVALLTARIKEMSQHFHVNKKDTAVQRAIVRLVAQRKKHLDYLKKSNPEMHQKTLKTLGLRK